MSSTPGKEQEAESLVSKCLLCRGQSHSFITSQRRAFSLDC